METEEGKAGSMYPCFLSTWFLTESLRKSKIWDSLTRPQMERENAVHDKTNKETNIGYFIGPICRLSTENKI